MDRPGAPGNNAPPLSQFPIFPMRVLFLILLMLLAGAPVQAGEFTVCVDSNDWGVYTYPDRDGALQTLVRAAATRLGGEIRFVGYPWRRCELMVEKGEIDGLLAVPWTDLSKGRFVFPMKDGQADPARAAAVVDLVLMRRADSPVTWDGKHLRGLDGTVAHVQGYAELGGALDALGIPNSDDYKSDLLDVRAMLAGRTNVIATYAESADMLAAMPMLAGRIVRMAPPFAHLPYYIAFGRDVYANRHDEIEALWRDIAEQRRGGGSAGDAVR